MLARMVKEKVLALPADTKVLRHMDPTVVGWGEEDQSFPDGSLGAIRV